MFPMFLTLKDMEDGLEISPLGSIVTRGMNTISPPIPITNIIIDILFDAIAFTAHLPFCA
jgi:hypothetical protein